MVCVCKGVCEGHAHINLPGAAMSELGVLVEIRHAFTREEAAVVVLRRVLGLRATTESQPRACDGDYRYSDTSVQQGERKSTESRFNPFSQKVVLMGEQVCEYLGTLTYSL